MLAQAWDRSVTDKERAHFCILVRLWLRQFEVEDANAVALFAIERSPVARADHDSPIRSFFTADVNHAVCDRWIALDAVRSRPKKQIARLQGVELE